MAIDGKSKCLMIKNFTHLKNISGIYCIQNNINKKMYIGKSENIHRRLLEHFRHLNRGTSGSTYLQHAWNKYGQENFDVYLIEVCGQEIIEEMERYYIKKYNTNNDSFGYNLTDGGDGISGYRWSDEARERRSASHLGERNHQYGKRGDANSNYGKKHSEETIELMKNNHVGFENKHHSEESIEKIKASSVGRKKSNASSKYFGVSYSNKDSRWVVILSVNKKSIYVGGYREEVTAAIAYDNYVIENSLPNPLNFPEDCGG